MDELEEEGEILLGRWDCGSCGERGIPGDAYACASCGAPRPDDVAFYLPEDAEVLTDAAAIAEAEAGPDWQCAFCASWMPATDASCTNCGASLADSERRQQQVDYAPGEVPRSSEDVEARRREADRPPPLPAPRAKARGRPRFPKLLVAGLAAALLAGGLIWGKVHSDRVREHERIVAVHRQRVAEAQGRVDSARRSLDAARKEVARARRAVALAEGAVAHARRKVDGLIRSLEAAEHAAVPVVVREHTWRVDLTIEQCVALDGKGWSHPPDAFDVRSEQRVHHHERVLDRIETRYRTETYQAQDGYRTEHTTERVSAGTRRVQAGYTTRNLGNGRFKRVPRYRTETVYRTVRKTRRVPRYVTRTRKVPYEEKVYRQDPVRRPWYRYKTKVWRPAPGMTHTGSGLQPENPAGSPPANHGTEPGARRIAGRSVTHSLVVQEDAGGTHTLIVAEARWRSFADGARGLLVEGTLLTPAERAARISVLKRRLVDARAAVPQLEALVPPLRAKVPPLEERVPPLLEALKPLESALAREKSDLANVISREP